MGQGEARVSRLCLGPQSRVPHPISGRCCGSSGLGWGHRDSVELSLTEACPSNWEDQLPPGGGGGGEFGQAADLGWLSSFWGAESVLGPSLPSEGRADGLGRRQSEPQPLLCPLSLSTGSRGVTGRLGRRLEVRRASSAMKPSQVGLCIWRGRPVCVCTPAHVRDMSGCVRAHGCVSVCLSKLCVYVCMWGCNVSIRVCVCVCVYTRLCVPERCDSALRGRQELTTRLLT